MLKKVFGVGSHIDSNLLVTGRNHELRTTVMMSRRQVVLVILLGALQQVQLPAHASIYVAMS